MGSGDERRRRRTGALTVLAAAAGLVVASTMVWKASTAAFTATTTNGTNTFSAGTVSITNNSSSTVLFNVGTLAPGATGTACIRVTYNGSLTAGVHLYGASLTASNGIDSQLTLQVDDGAFASVPAFPACTTFTPANSLFSGTLNAFGTNDVAWASGVGGWTPTGSGQTRDFRFTYTLASSAPNSVQGGSASLSFVWEAQTP